MIQIRHTAAEESSSGEKEDINNQQNIMSGLGADLDQVNANAATKSEEALWKKGESQQSFSTTDDQNKDSERQDGLSTSFQMDYRFDNIGDEEKDGDFVQDIVSPVEQNISHSNYQNKEITKDDVSHRSSQVKNLFTDNIDLIQCPVIKES